MFQLEIFRKKSWWVHPEIHIAEQWISIRPVTLLMCFISKQQEKFMYSFGFGHIAGHNTFMPKQYSRIILCMQLRKHLTVSCKSTVTGQGSRMASARKKQTLGSWQPNCQLCPIHAQYGCFKMAWIDTAFLNFSKKRKVWSENANIYYSSGAWSKRIIAEVFKWHVIFCFIFIEKCDFWSNCCNWCANFDTFCMTSD